MRPRSANEWRDFWRDGGERELHGRLDEFAPYSVRIATLLGSNAPLRALVAEAGGLVTAMDGTPFTSRGSGMPATSRIVGAMSMQWWNCERRPPRSEMPFGQDITSPLRVPPKCDATCFIH